MKNNSPNLGGWDRVTYATKQTKRYQVKHNLRRSQRIGDSCYYCGLPASSKDHVIPISVWQSFEAANIEVPKNRILLVPACTECNSLLSNSYQRTLQERKTHLKHKLKKRYLKLLRSPEWSDYELSFMGPGMQALILHSREEKELIIERLKR